MPEKIAKRRLQDCDAALRFRRRADPLDRGSASRSAEAIRLRGIGKRKRSGKRRYGGSSP
jgi:hypothetical protein